MYFGGVFPAPLHFLRRQTLGLGYGTGVVEGNGVGVVDGGAVFGVTGSDDFSLRRRGYRWNFRSFFAESDDGQKGIDFFFHLLRRVSLRWIDAFTMNRNDVVVVAVVFVFVLVMVVVVVVATVLFSLERSRRSKSPPVDGAIAPRCRRGRCGRIHRG